MLPLDAQTCQVMVCAVRLFTATVIDVDPLMVGADEAYWLTTPKLVENLGQLDAVKPVPVKVTSVKPLLCVITLGEIEFNVGVSRSQVYEIKRIDSDYFADE